MAERWLVDSLGGRLVDSTARRPSGWIGRRMYRTGPKAHEASFDAALAANMFFFIYDPEAVRCC